MKRKTAEYLMRAEKISSLYHKSSEDVSMVGFIFCYYYFLKFGLIELFCLVVKRIQA